MKKYRPVALYLLSMAALAGFLYVDGTVWHHGWDKGFILFLVCLVMGISLLLAGYTVWLIRAMTKRPKYPKEIKHDPRIGRKARCLTCGEEGRIVRILQLQDGDEVLEMQIGSIGHHGSPENFVIEEESNP